MNTHAQRYIDAGLRPIPVWPPSAGCRCERAHPLNPEQCYGKVPRDRSWADRGPFTVAEFEPTDNVALAMGEQPDGRWLVAIDVDGDARLPAPLPASILTVSGRGRHYIYSVPPFTPLGNYVDAFSARDKTTGYKPGHSGAIDLRYARGAVVAGPSLHRSGARYVTTLAPVAPLPAEWLRAIYAARRARGLPVEARWTRAEGKRP